MKYIDELFWGQRIAERAGKIMLKYFDIDQEILTKTDGSPVTIADRLINAEAISILQMHFPEDGIIGEEESTSDYGMGRKWICDPIDGTRAYTWGVPTAMFSLSLVVDGIPMVGIAHDPFMRVTYTAIQGHGVDAGDRPIEVCKRGLKGSPIGVCSSFKNRKLPYLDKLSDMGSHLVTLNGAVFKACLVAKGKLAGYVEHTLNPHDTAGAQVIVEEAGGKVTGMKGEPLDYSKPFKGAIMSNGVIHDELVALVNS